MWEILCHELIESVTALILWFGARWAWRNNLPPSFGNRPVKVYQVRLLPVVSFLPKSKNPKPSPKIMMLNATQSK